MKVPVRASLISNDEKSDYANYCNTRIITLFQIPHYDQLQILICNGNSLTTLAGVEHIKHLWKLDVGNNQIRSLQHLSRFIALGSLNLSNNRLQWLELQHIRHMFILDLRLDGNPILDDRQHVIDCLPRIWMCDGIFISTLERTQVEEFFNQSSLATKPVRHKLARDIFMPTNLKDRSVNGLFGSKAMELFAKFPMNCFVNAELDKKRLKHLASTIQDIWITEMNRDQRRKEEEFLLGNRHILHHMIDLRQSHVEEFNMFLILLLTDLLYQIPGDLLNSVLDVTRINTIENLQIPLIFSSSNELKCTIASLIHAGVRLDRDENHSSIFPEKLFHSLSTVLTNEIRDISSPIMSQPFPNTNLVIDAKTMVCLEVMQVFIMCPVFYTMIQNPNVSAILQQALDRSPAYESIRNVLESLIVDQKTAEEQKELLSPILGNIIKMTIRTFSNKRTKKLNETISTLTAQMENESSIKREIDPNLLSPRPRVTQHRVPTIGDRILTAPQTFGRIVTIPDADIAMIQMDHILAINGSMTTHGSLNDHTNYVSMNHFEWDPVHEYWKPKHTQGDKITLQISPNAKDSASRSNVSLTSSLTTRSLSTKTSDQLSKSRSESKLVESNLRRAKEIHPEPTRAAITDYEENPMPTSQSQEHHHDHRMAIRMAKQNYEVMQEDSMSNSSPVLIESMLLLMPDQSSHPAMNMSEQRPGQAFSTSTTMNEFDNSSSTYRRSANHRVPVPVHNATLWFNGPDMQNERSERMEKVVSSLVRRSYRSSANNAMPKVPTLTSPSSRDHAMYKAGLRSGGFQDFCVESQRIAPPSTVPHMRLPPSAKDRYGFYPRSYDPNRTYHSSPNIYRTKNFANQPCPTPAWM